MHTDSHDVFVFQTAGAKQWEVHTPEGVDEIRLEPGLSMYLPTGTPHAARAQDTVSLHVTLGINQLTWRGLIRRTSSPCSPGCPTTTFRAATWTTRPRSPPPSPVASATWPPPSSVSTRSAPSRQRYAVS